MTDFNEPQPPDTPAAEPTAEPFEPGPANLSGCGKPAVIGCLVVLALGAVGLILLLSQSPKLLRFAMSAMEEQVAAALPPDLAVEKRERLEAGFDGAINAILEGRVDAGSMARLQSLSRAMPSPGETLSEEKVDEIILLLEEIAAVTGVGARNRLRPPVGRLAAR